MLPALALLTLTSRRGIRLAFVLVGGACATAAQEQAQASVSTSSAGPCLPADSVTAITIPMLDSIANGTTAEMRATRDSLGIPVASRVRTSVVMKSSTCAKAAAAVDSIAGSPVSGRQVYVYQMGKVYAVEDPNRTAGGWRQIAFFTSAFAYKASLAQ